MTQLNITYEKRKADEHMSTEGLEALKLYLDNTEGVSYKDLQRFAEIFVSQARYEYVFWKDSVIVGGFSLILADDMHYGRVCVVMNHYVSEPSREANELFMWYLKRFCKTLNVKYYQRSRHVSPNRQLIITKEV